MTMINPEASFRYSKPESPVVKPPAAPSLRTSIIVVNLNGGSRVRRCIESIRTKTYLPFELIVIDNGSADGSLAYLESLHDITLIANAGNVGAPAARNQGLAVADGDFIVFLDNDTIVTDGWMRRFHACAHRNPRTGIIGPMSNCVSGPQFVSGVEYRLDDSLDRFANQWAAAHDGEIMPIRRLILFCMFVRRQVVDKIGGIDPAFGRWGWEDDDYSVRAQRAGFELTVARDIFIHHEGSYTAKSSNIDYRQLHKDNWHVFRRKWNIDWVPGQASQAQLDAFFNQAFVPERDYVPLPSRPDIADLIRRDDRSTYCALPPDTAAAASEPAANSDMRPSSEHMRMGRSLMDASDWKTARYHFQCAGQDASMAAEAHYGCGVCCYQLGDFHRSAVHCQQALSWIPDFLGITPKYRSYLLDRPHTHPYKARFTADIYILLAGAYLHLQRPGDASLALQAARQLDGSRRDSTRELEKRIIDLDRHRPADHSGQDLPDRLAANAQPELSKKLTVLLTTHYSEKIRHNKDLAPPDVGLIQATYRSLCAVFGPVTTSLRKIICLDRGISDSCDSRLYESNLEIFVRKNRCELLRARAAGLQSLLTEAIKLVSTPYLLLVEHDWCFQSPSIDIQQLIRAFDDHCQIQQVRFNQRRNAIARFDYLLEQETTISDVPLLRTAAHSNNPSIFRTSTLRDVWLPLCRQDPTYSAMELSGTAFGIEEPLFKRHIQDIRRMGFSRAHEKWGTFVYGNAGDPEKIVHLGF